MISVDGAGAGGQLLRTAVALAAVTGEAVRIENVRSGRPEPGLKPQHLAAVRAVATACDADVEGDELESTTVTFEPGPVRGGEITADIGTAGSVTLLFDALLPLAVETTGPIRATATGGTDVEWSPPMDYYRHVKLPLLRTFGLDADVTLDRTGFYPAGGGRATLTVRPSSLAPLALRDRGPLDAVTVYSKASTDLKDARVVERQATAAESHLDDAGLTPDSVESSDVETRSPGSAVVVGLDYANGAGGFSALGRRGYPAEDVAGDAAAPAIRFHDGRSVVDRHLADQLVSLLGLAGGTARIPAVTDHVRASVELLEAFGIEVQLQAAGAGSILTG